MLSSACVRLEFKSHSVRGRRPGGTWLARAAPGPSPWPADVRGQPPASLAAYQYLVSRLVRPACAFGVVRHAAVARESGQGHRPFADEPDLGAVRVERL